MHNVSDVRQKFSWLLEKERFTSVNREASMTGLMGNVTLEIVNANFIADEDSIFGDVNWDYVKREEAWYHSESLNVNDIPGGAPAVWKSVADPEGFINSNYGWCVYSPENLGRVPGVSQFTRVCDELTKNPESRRAVIIYTRPSMWDDYNKNGRSDFMCTNDVQYLVRDGQVHAIVQMRSNDAIFGFRNDRAWQRHVQEHVKCNLNAYRNLPLKDGEPWPEQYSVGPLHWNAGSLHIYKRHFYLVDHFTKTGETSITKASYDALYPFSKYSNKD